MLGLRGLPALALSRFPKTMRAAARRPRPPHARLFRLRGPRVSVPAAESLLGAASAAANTGSRDLGWREVEGAWVLAPSAGAKPRALVHFIGGGAVGASPQLTYRLFLEALAEKGDVLVVATPFAIGFEHLRIVLTRTSSCSTARSARSATKPRACPCTASGTPWAR